MHVEKDSLFSDLALNSLSWLPVSRLVPMLVRMRERESTQGLETEWVFFYVLFTPPPSSNKRKCSLHILCPFVIFIYIFSLLPLYSLLFSITESCKSSFMFLTFCNSDFFACNFSFSSRLVSFNLLFSACNSLFCSFTLQISACIFFNSS